MKVTRSRSLEELAEAGYLENQEMKEMEWSVEILASLEVRIRLGFQEENSMEDDETNADFQSGVEARRHREEKNGVKVEDEVKGLRKESYELNSVFKVKNNNNKINTSHPTEVSIEPGEIRHFKLRLLKIFGYFNR